MCPFSRVNRFGLAFATPSRGPKKVAPAPAVAKTAKPSKAPKNVLFEKSPKNFGIGGDVQPKRDMSRYVRWPEYILLQRQKAILQKRLKVPPTINQFAKAADKNLASNVFKLLNKYRPETKQEKKERLKGAAEKVTKGEKLEGKKPTVVKFGINHITALIESKKAQLVVIANDVDPIELVLWLPALCRKMGVPYVIVKGKARLGTVVHKKTATALALTDVTAEDKKTLADLLTASKEAHTEKDMRKWSDSRMGQKSINKTAKRAKALAKSQQGAKKE